MRVLILLTLALITSCSSPSKKTGPQTCMASREFITTMEYLREQKNFALNDNQSKDLANKVSTGCSGASKRFIQVTNLLIKSGLPSQKAIATGLDYALDSDDSFEAFMAIFKSSYIESLLDLDLGRSLKVATELSKDFKGSKKNLINEFNKFVNFCVNRKSLDLPLMNCADTAKRVVKSGEDYEFNISQDFIELFSYLTDKNQSNLPTYEALKVAENVVKFGPEAKSSFIKAYEYGVSKNGLDISSHDAIELGTTMASRSIVKETK
jgi:hypothetical protein